MTRVLIAAPVMDRAWVLPTWLRAVEQQRTPDIDVEVCVFWEPSEDPADTTLELLRQYRTPTWTDNDGREWHDATRDKLRLPLTILGDDRLISPRTSTDITEHHWALPMYEHMAKLRNRIARYAEERGFDYLFALDSDVILHPGDVERFLDGLPPDTIIGPLVNMKRATPEEPTPLRWNYMTWSDHPDNPRDEDGQPLMAEDGSPAGADLCMESGRHEVDVLVAAILIPVRDGLPRWIAYPQGEDVGFPANARRAGLRFLADTDVVCRHIMNRRVLDPVE